MIIFHCADSEEIKAGKATDAYFPRTLEILKKKVDAQVKAEFVGKGLPHKCPWSVLSGVEESIELLSGLKVSVRSMDEGTVFKSYQPLMEIEEKYSEFGLYETALLGFLCQSTGVATKAARFKIRGRTNGNQFWGTKGSSPCSSGYRAESLYRLI
jgi:nicotinate phosphoribosyltransferase